VVTQKRNVLSNIVQNCQLTVKSLLLLLSSAAMLRLGDRALVGGTVVGGVLGPLNQEARDLDLAGGVEGDQADVRLRECLGAGSHLLKDLAGVSAAEHGNN